MSKTYQLTACFLSSVITLTGCASCSTDQINNVHPDAIRIVLLGDSNTDYGYSEPDAKLEHGGYINSEMYRSDENSHWQLSGILEEISARPILVVNHGIGGTNTGFGYGLTGGHGPNAREAIDGITRFEAEVLGKGSPSWTANGVARVHAFVPTSKDFAYISLGTNDCRYGLSYSSTLVNLRWMIDTWKAQGLPASHLLITTIPPTGIAAGCETNEVNPRIRELLAETGVTLIDLAAYTSPDDGLTWRYPSFSVTPPDDVHYRYVVRVWLAREILAVITRLHGTP